MKYAIRMARAAIGWAVLMDGQVIAHTNTSGEALTVGLAVIHALELAGKECDGGVLLVNLENR